MRHNKILLVAGASVATVALLAMLAYNFRHTGQLLARHVDPPGYGYGAAAGIELGVLVLAVAIGTRKWHGLKTRWLEAVLVFVLAVSFLANVAEGHLERYGTDITSVTMTRIDWVQGLISLAATGLISVIVMAMSEIIGQSASASTTAPPSPAASPT
jgi:uncharacterized membrane protein YphA (DoxX/SURF4 family)